MTAAQNMNPKLRILIPVVRGLAKILGKDYEVNLHDVSIPERSLVLCENGYVTGRSEGGPMTDFGLLMLQSEEYQSREGVCIFIRDENDKIIGFLCINYDLKKAVAAQELIEGLLRVEMSGAGVEPAEEPGARFPEPVRESFAQDIDEVVGDSLAQVKRRIGKPFKYLTKPEKKEVVRELHDKGFFLLKGSVDILAAEMGNTKFTIYSYIREIQKKD